MTTKYVSPDLQLQQSFNIHYVPCVLCAVSRLSFHVGFRTSALISRTWITFPYWYRSSPTAPLQVCSSAFGPSLLNTEDQTQKNPPDSLTHRLHDCCTSDNHTITVYSQMCVLVHESKVLKI